MSRITRQEVLAKERNRYARADKEYKSKIISERGELFGSHRQAALRALRPRTVGHAPFVPGRSREYAPDRLRAPLQAIRLPAYEAPARGGAGGQSRHAEPALLDPGAGGRQRWCGNMGRR